MKGNDEGREGRGGEIRLSIDRLMKVVMGRRREGRGGGMGWMKDREHSVDECE